MHMNMEQAKVSLEFGNYGFLQNLRGVMFEKDFCDVTLISDDQKILKSHKLVLSACSAIFKTIIQNSNHSYPVIYLRGIKYAEINAILTFLYNGEALISKSNLQIFLKVVEDLKIKDLVYDSELMETCSTNEGDVTSDDNAVVDQPTHLDNADNLKEKPTVDVQERLKTFSTTEEKILEAFLKEREDQVKDVIVCDICDFKLGSDEEFKVHKNSVHLMCDICDKIYATYQCVKVHKKSQHEMKEKPFRFECKNCDYKSNSKEKLRIHCEAIHQNVQYECDICHKVSNDPSNARRHKRIMHSSVRYPCSECDYRGSTSENLKQHIKSHNRTEREHNFTITENSLFRSIVKSI